MKQIVYYVFFGTVIFNNRKRLLESHPQLSFKKLSLSTISMLEGDSRGGGNILIEIFHKFNNNKSKYHAYFL
jgi:hypothetical protein